MTLPERTYLHSAAHQDALDRRDDARAEQRHRRDEHDAARATHAEPRAAAGLAAANERLAAREAWVAWIERDY